MPIITVSRELGSLGTRIAEGVAQRIGAACVDKEVLAEMARQADVQVEEIVEDEERLLSRPVVVSEEMRALFAHRQGKGRSGLSEENYIERMSAAVEALGQGGNIVFVGRGVQMILAGRPGILHTHIYAPPKIRAARVQAARNLSDPVSALQIVQRADERRRNWFRRFFTGANWKDPRYYHLMINTGRLGVDTAVDLIVVAAESPSP
ncbi:MAG: AAA family ATPase [Caldilineaceae bacterium]